MKKLLLIFGIFIFTVVSAERTKVTFDSCVDGDTAWLKYEGKSRKFRFIGINAPEIEHEEVEEEYMGNESRDFTCDSLKNAKKIEIEFDKNSKKQDKFNRYLAWIWIDDNLLQEDLIKNGLAKVDYVYDEYKYISKLCNVELEAYSNKKGIWSKNKKLGYCKNHEYEDKSYEKIEEEEKVEEELDYKLIVIAFIIISIVVIVLVIVTIYVLNKKS